MRHGIAILLAFLIMGASVHLDEWMKTPFLIHHFIEHRSQDAETSIFDFLAVHYTIMSLAGLQMTHDNDRKLPAKSDPPFPPHLTVFVFEEENAIVVYPVSVNHGFLNSITKILVRGFDIWQPPKVSGLFFGTREDSNGGASYCTTGINSLSH